MRSCDFVLSSKSVVVIYEKRDVTWGMRGERSLERDVTWGMRGERSLVPALTGHSATAVCTGRSAAALSSKSVVVVSEERHVTWGMRGERSL
ncbi:hypothetical protein J6590_062346 [Homalodisca vitripennis]|nr:hypothetical protein J6590_062346 [Homalodisca vitripennis]